MWKERGFSYVRKLRISFESCTFHFRAQGLLLDVYFEKQGFISLNSQLSGVVMSRLFGTLKSSFLISESLNCFTLCLSVMQNIALLGGKPAQLWQI